jgi:hypothetical protein
MKRTFCLLFLILLLNSCAINNPSSSTDIPALPGSAIDNPISPTVVPDSSFTLEINILGKYICSSEYFNDEYFLMHKESIPSINFYENGKCEFTVNYFDGVYGVEGVYIVYGEQIQVNLDLQGTIFEGEDENYMDDQYVLSIIDDNKIVIDRGCYAVEAGDLFAR